jgi:DNA segregation ATPase FtsK/SpoIIIE, S-DNA-T family
VPFVFGARPVGVQGVGQVSGRSDLDRLVDAANDAFVRGGYAPPRRPWLEMLPERIGLDQLDQLGGFDEPTGQHDQPHHTDGGRHGQPHRADDIDAATTPGVVPLGLADEPERQRHVVTGWDPAGGHLALFGTVGSGTTTALHTLAQAVTRRPDAHRWQLYALDFGAGELTHLEVLPCVGSVIGANDRERQHRLVRRLGRELDRRRDLSASDLADQPRLLVLVDDLAAFLAAHEAIESAPLIEDFRRVFSEGTVFGICFAVTGDRAGAVPHRLASAVGKRLVLRLADDADYAAFGLRERELPTFVPGRAVETDTRRVVQLALPLPTATVAAPSNPDAGTPPPRIRALPSDLEAATLPAGRRTDGGLWLPVGVGDEELAPVGLQLHPGEHALVAGPARSGRTSTLLLLAQMMRRTDPDAILVGICRPGSGLHGAGLLDASGPPSALRRVLLAAPDDPRRWLVLIDDAPGFDDDDGLLHELATCHRDGLHLIGAARTDELRGDYGQWHRRLRRARTGILLQPELPGDGELLGTRLPRRVAVPLSAPGRGFLVNAAAAELVQLARPATSGRGRRAA